MKAQQLDALLFPGASGAGIAAQAGLSDRDRAVRHGAERADAARFPPGSTRSRRRSA